MLGGIKVNNAYRSVLCLPGRSSASAMYTNFGIQNFESVIRKSTFGCSVHHSSNMNFKCEAMRYVRNQNNNG